MICFRCLIVGSSVFVAKTKKSLHIKARNDKHILQAMYLNILYVGMYTNPVPFVKI